MHTIAEDFSNFRAQTVEAGDRRFEIRRSIREDLPAILALLADDVLGKDRESTADSAAAAYDRAFDAIDSDPRQLLVSVVEGSLVGTLQLSLIPGLSRQGSFRVQVEAVRISPSTQGLGLGTRVFEWVHAYSRRLGVDLVQLTTDKRRTDAHRFYERLGYVASHEGMKLTF